MYAMLRIGIALLTGLALVISASPGVAEELPQEMTAISVDGGPWEVAILTPFALFFRGEVWVYNSTEDSYDSTSSGSRIRYHGGFVGDLEIEFQTQVPIFIDC